MVKKIVSWLLIPIIFLITLSTPVCAANLPSLKLEVWKENGKVYARTENVSDADIKHITIYLALFDKSGKLTECAAEVITYTAKGEKDIAYFNLSDKKINSAYNAKVFAWSNGMPCSEAIYLKKDGIYSDKKSLVLWLQAYNPKMYSYGDEYTLNHVPIIVNNVLMSDLSPIAEALYCTVKWEDTTETIVIDDNKGTMILQVNNAKAFFDGNEFTLSEPPCIKDGAVYVPTADIFMKFGYISEFNPVANELFVSGNETEERIEAIESHSVLPEYLFKKERTEHISRLDAAHLLTAIYETITTEDMEISDETEVADTEDICVKKILSANIAEISSSKMFYPEKTVTNIDFAIMLYKTLEAADVSLSYDEDAAELFCDDSCIPWQLKKTVYSLKSYGAFKTAYINVFASSEPITAGQALITAGNCLDLSYFSNFWDVDPDSTYRKAIVRLSRNNIFYGYEDGSFHPEDFLTRAEFCVLATRIMSAENIDSYEFSCGDVSVSHWGSKYIGYCVSMGIFELQDEKFRPDTPILNIEVVSALLKMLGYSDISSETEIFETAGNIGITKNITLLKPYNKAERQEIAQFLFNTLNIM